MPQYTYHIAPRDLLFLRDARPMAAADAGLGGNWPRPDQLWNALINAFHSQWPNAQPWEHQHRQNDRDANHDSSFRFGALKTAGPFPVTVGAGGKSELFLPCPLDLSADDDGKLYPMQLIPMSRETANLPAPLTHAFASSKLGKHEAPEWLTLADFNKYLDLATSASLPHLVTESISNQLFDRERQIGIAIDPLTHSTVEHQLYQAEYLRLRDHTRLAFAAACEIVGADRKPVDLLGKPPFNEAVFDFVMGGQQGVVKALRTPQALPLPDSRLDNKAKLLKWVLLSPAVFPEISAGSAKAIKAHPGGWLPNWIDAETGQVMLPRAAVEKLPGEKREDWRRRLAAAPRFSAKLVAARIGKPLAFSGWDLRTGPKPNLHAVPAGSVYVFACADPGEAKELAAALDWNGAGGCEVRNRRSTLFGEKGFGLGVCASWKA